MTGIKSTIFTDFVYATSTKQHVKSIINKYVYLHEAGNMLDM